jgi:hypothetical protein
LAGWTLSFALLTTSIALAVVPIAVFFGGVATLGTTAWDGDTSIFELLVASLIGCLLFVATLHLQNGLVALWRWLARGLLAEGELPAERISQHAAAPAA